ncbi:HSP20-like chaperone [Mollisia scopiformis]|uniref:HSP20-like chaperone n=1 Tax=Mollisia scopiformis TaxID=149040 RepID=A0A194WYU9_MOLSC|nr:HSP20-like chaperone [Mollisia scopiformis]KUJ13120.1 HSP20-like chaperone [Mollisia scopiformis]
MDTINALLHPHHVSLGKNYTSIHMLHQHIDDPYYSLDHHASHKGVSVPRFNIREGQKAFYLEGELPGLTHLSDVVCEFIGNQTMIIRGAIKSFVFAGEGEQTQAAALKDSKAPVETSLTWRLNERHIGKFERSFTFSSRVKPTEIHTSLDSGVLSIAVPKDKEADAKEAAKSEIENEE